MTVTELRKDIYRVFDEILETGESKVVTLRGKRLLILPAEAGRRRNLDDLPVRQATTCSFDELVETTWEHAWKGAP